MKFSCTCSDLAQAVAIAMRAVPNRPSHPILSAILLEVEDKVHLTGFDISIGVQCACPAVVDKPGKTAVPGKLFSDIISKLTGDVLIDVEGAAMTITSGGGFYQIQCMDPSEYPALPKPSGTAFSLPAELLLEGIQQTLFACSVDEAKQILTGLNIGFTAHGLQFGSTDGHRMATVAIDIEEPCVEEDTAVTVPAKALRDLIKLMGPKDEVLIAMNRADIVFNVGDRTLTSRVLSGQYPNYKQLIPAIFASTIIVSRRSLIEALERVAVMADQKNNTVRLDFGRDDIVVSADADTGSAKETVPLENLSGEPISAAFNVRYLLDGLKAIAASEVQINLNRPTSPVTINPLAGGMTYLVMPVQIREPLPEAVTDLVMRRL